MKTMKMYDLKCSLQKVCGLSLNINATCICVFKYDIIG